MKLWSTTYLYMKDERSYIFPPSPKNHAGWSTYIISPPTPPPLNDNLHLRRSPWFFGPEGRDLLATSHAIKPCEQQHMAPCVAANSTSVDSSLDLPSELLNIEQADSDLTHQQIHVPDRLSKCQQRMALFYT